MSFKDYAKHKFKESLKILPYFLWLLGLIIPLSFLPEILTIIWAVSYIILSVIALIVLFDFSAWKYENKLKEEETK